MTSVRNHPLRSNGSRLLVALGLALLLGSCALIREAFDLPAPEDKGRAEDEELDPVVGNRVWDPYQQRWVTREDASETLETVDTVTWREAPAAGRTPIGDPDTRDPFAPGRTAGPPDEAEGLPAGTSRKVALVLPFLGSTFDTLVPAINPNSSWALQFYSGARLALDSLDRLGTRLEVSIYDSEASQAVVGGLVADPDGLPTNDLLIGPYRRDNARLLAPFARQWQTPLVSPYTAADDITDDNPYYIQVSPSLATHYRALTFHALEQVRPEEVVLVARDNPAERQRLAYFQEAHYFREGTRSVPPLEAFIVTDSTADLQDLNLKPLIRRGGTTCIMLPVADETFVYSFLRKLELARRPEDDIRVYGMPQWIGYEYIDPEYLHSLQVHISSNYYVDPDDPRVLHFQEQFLRQYGTLPQPEAFVGFDLMLYFGRMLQQFGDDLPREMTGRPQAMLHTYFNFEPVIIPTTTGAEQLPVERYENQFLHILQFKDFGFLPTR